MLSWIALCYPLTKILIYGTIKIRICGKCMNSHIIVKQEQWSGETLKNSSVHFFFFFFLKNVLSSVNWVHALNFVLQAFSKWKGLMEGTHPLDSTRAVLCVVAHLFYPLHSPHYCAGSYKLTPQILAWKSVQLSYMMLLNYF